MQGSERGQHGNAFSLLETAQAVRCLVRVGLAFALYLAAHPLWVGTGLQALYGKALLDLADPLVRLSSHFHVAPFLLGVTIVNLDFPIVFALCLWGVSPSLWDVSGLGRLARAVAALLICHVATTVLQVHLSAGQQFLREKGILIFLPWEYWSLGALKYLLQGLGLQLQTFLVIFWFTLLPALTAKQTRPARGSAERAMGPAQWHRTFLIVAAAFCTAVVVVVCWRAVRSADPHHQQAHIVIAGLLINAGNPSVARREYERALIENPQMVEAWLGLARMAEGSGNRSEARSILERALRTLGLRPGRERVEAALQRADIR